MIQTKMIGDRIFHAFLAVILPVILSIVRFCIPKSVDKIE